MSYSFSNIFESDPDFLKIQFQKILDKHEMARNVVASDRAPQIIEALHQSLKHKDTYILISAVDQVAQSNNPEFSLSTSMAILEILDELKHAVAQQLTSGKQLTFYRDGFPIMEKMIQEVRQQLLDEKLKRLSGMRKKQIQQFEAEIMDYNNRLTKRQILLNTLFGLANEFFIIVLNNKSLIQNFSQGAGNFLGYQISEVLGKSPEMLHPTWFNENGHLDKIRQAMKQNSEWSGEVTYKHKDGHDLLATLSLNQIRSPNGDLWGELGIGRDISEQRQLQDQMMKYTSDLQLLVEERGRELDETEDRYKHLIEDINEGYFIAQDNMFVFTNSAFAGITGYTQEELKRMDFFDLIVRRNRKLARTWWRKVQSEQDSHEIEFMITRKDDSKAVVECKAQPLELRGIQNVIGVLNDITEKKKMEFELRRYVNNLEKMVAERTGELEKSVRELESTQFQLIQSQKLAGIGILSAGVAHEINNPLQALLLKSKHILHHIDNTDIVTRSTNDIIKYVNRMAEIVRGLSKYARTIKDDDSLAPVDLLEIIKESLELSYHTRNFGDIIVKREFSPISLVKGNSGQYQQIFINLIINAIDAMEGRGRLTLRLKKYSSSMVQMEVEDTGSGIPDENMEKIFTPLFTTKPSGKGTGMGLHVAYRIITEYGGSISVKSKLNTGTTFALLFPLANNDTEA